VPNAGRKCYEEIATPAALALALMVCVIAFVVGYGLLLILSTTASVWAADVVTADEANYA